MILLSALTLAAPLTCAELIEMKRSRLPAGVVVDVVTSSGLIAADLPCVEAAELDPSVLAAVRLHLVESAQPPAREAPASTEGPEQPAADVSRIVATEFQRTASASLTELADRLEVRRRNTASAGVGLALAGVGLGGLGAVLYGVGSAPLEEGTIPTEEAIRSKQTLSVLGLIGLSVGVSWTGGGIALAASAAR